MDRLTQDDVLQVLSTLFRTSNVGEVIMRYRDKRMDSADPGWFPRVEKLANEYGVKLRCEMPISDFLQKDLRAIEGAFEEQKNGSGESKETARDNCEEESGRD